jgi:transposase
VDAERESNRTLTAVRLVLDEGKSIPSVARDLDLTESNLRLWVTRARADRTHGRTGLTTAEREELTRLRKENRELRTEREILKKPRPSSRGTSREICLDRGGDGLPTISENPERCLKCVVRNIVEVSDTWRRPQATIVSLTRTNALADCPKSSADYTLPPLPHIRQRIRKHLSSRSGRPASPA